MSSPASAGGGRERSAFRTQWPARPSRPPGVQRAPPRPHHGNAPASAYREDALAAGGPPHQRRSHPLLRRAPQRGTQGLLRPQPHIPQASAQPPGPEGLGSSPALLPDALRHTRQEYLAESGFEVDLNDRKNTGPSPIRFVPLYIEVRKYPHTDVGAFTRPPAAQAVPVKHVTDAASGRGLSTIPKPSTDRLVS